jgi:hypothetical protein
MKVLIYGIILTAIYFIDYTWFAWILCSWGVITFVLPVVVAIIKQEIKNQS